MRHLTLTGFLLAASLLSCWTSGGSPAPLCRTLTPEESAGKSAGTFHYCSFVMPVGQACSTCTLSIHWASRPMMPGMPPFWFNLYQKCSSTPPNSVCWQQPFTTSPNPTCDLNQAACTGTTTLFWNSTCLDSNGTPNPNEQCSQFYPAGYMAGTGGLATGPNCNGMPSVIYPD